jgi:hypothetical protein
MPLPRELVNWWFWIVAWMDTLLLMPLRLTPLGRVIDRDDLNYLRSRVETDLATAKELLRRQPADGALKEVEGELRRLSDAPFSWNVAQTWTEYGALRRRLIAFLPPSAWQAALVELTITGAGMVPAMGENWKALAEKTDKLVHEDYRDPKNAAQQPQIADEICFNLQELWTEIDFARARWAFKIAKLETITNLTWLALVLATVGVAHYLPRYYPTSDRVSVKLLLFFGFLGGAVSALRASSDFGGLDTRKLSLETVKIRLRPALGAMAALVLYVIGRSGLVFSLGQPPVESAAQSHGALIALQVIPAAVPAVYYVLAFLGGFSERFFMRMLDRAQERFPATSQGTARP